MQYWETPELAQRLGGQALELMIRHAVAATPPNFELWYAYAKGAMPELTHAIDQTIAEGRITDAPTLRELHTRFFEQVGHAAFDDLTVQLNDELRKFAGVLESAGVDTATYGRSLNTAATQLSQGDVARISVIVENLAGATRAIEARHKDVEAELQISGCEVERLRQSLEAIRKESHVDSLTGLYNRRGFEMRISQTLVEAHEHALPVSVLMGDIDHFKRFNDTWGHVTGDQVLRLVAHGLKSSIRDADTAARYGGEEFVVLLPGTTLDGAASIAEKIRLTVSGKKIIKRSTGDTLGTITISIGAAQVLHGEHVADTIQRADACLYAAKNSGRNRVCTQPDVSPTEAGRTRSA